MAKAKAEPKKLGWDELGDGERNEMLDRRLRGADTGLLCEQYNLKMSPDSLRRRLDEWKKHNEREAIVGTTANHEATWDLYCEFIGRNPKRPILSKKRKTTTRRKVAVLCDLHGIPHPELVKRLLADDAIDVVVCDGDLLDASAFSSYPKLPSSGPHTTISQEIANVRALLESLAAKGCEVHINGGNHDDRVELYFSNNVAAKFLPLCQWNVLELVSQGIPKTFISKNSHTFTSGAGSVSVDALTTNWITCLGDAFIGHAGIARKGEARSVDGFAEWVHQWRRPLNWPEPSLIVQAHVHRAAVTYPAGSHEVRVEGGFSGDPVQLQWQMERGGSGGPPAIGYTVFEQAKKNDEWLTDRSTVRFIMC